MVGADRYRAYLEELRLEYSAICKDNDNIKQRAIQMMSFIGIIMAVVTGFGLLDSIGSDLLLLAVAALLIMVPALWLYFDLIRTKRMAHIIHHYELPDERISRSVLSNICDSIFDTDLAKFYTKISNKYLESIENEKIDNKKFIRYFNAATGFFIASIIFYIVIISFQYSVKMASQQMPV